MPLIFGLVGWGVIERVMQGYIGYTVPLTCKTLRLKNKFSSSIHTHFKVQNEWKVYK